MRVTPSSGSDGSVLMLLRHGKAEPRSATGVDFDRQLSTRGRKDSEAVGAFALSHGWLPDLALVSDAPRAQQTFDVFQRALGISIATRLCHAVYTAADADDLLAQIRCLGDKGKALAMVGHNPTISQLAVRLSALSPHDSQLPLSSGSGSVDIPFPTAALCRLRVDVSTWSDVRPGTARPEGFVRPGML